MPESFEDLVVAALAKRNYQPVPPKMLAKKLGVSAPEYPALRWVRCYNHGRT